MTAVAWKNLPLRFIYTGLIYLLISSIIGLLSLKNPAFVPAHSHLMLAGFVSLTIIGSMYQLVPTVTGTELRLKQVAEASYFLVNAGLILLLASFIGFTEFRISGSIYILGVMAFTFVILLTLTDMKLRSPAIPFFAAAIGFYLAGTFYAVFAISGLLSFSVLTHSTILMLGWVGITTFGGLYELFPMLSIRKLKSVIVAYLTLPLAFLSVLLIAYGFQVYDKEMVLIGRVIFALSFVLLTANLMLTLVKKPETPSPLDISVKFFVPALFFGLTGLIASLFNAERYIATHLYLVGWIALTIMGAEYHIIPMITWMEKYSARLGVEEVPMIADLFSERLAHSLLIGSVAGVCLLAFEPLRIAGGVIITLVFILFTYDMFMVQRR